MPRRGEGQAVQQDGQDDEDEPAPAARAPARGRTRGDTLSITAIVVSVLGGGSSLGLNVRSNSDLAAKVDTLVAKLEWSIKANDESRSELRSRVERAELVGQEMRAEIATLKAEVAGLKHAREK